MKKLQLGALALATVLTLGGATTFASQNQNENKLGTTSIGATASTTATKATAEEIAKFESAPKAGTLVTASFSSTPTMAASEVATKATAEEIAQNEKMVKSGTATTASTAATPTEAATTKK